IIFHLLSIAAISIVELQNNKINIDSLNLITPSKQQKEKLNNYYLDKEKGMLEVKGYQKSQDHVIISFNDTSYRVFTSKKYFNELIK
ncbi:hypothetical protein LCGC14_1118730, partial [marine sediment metagenome]